MTSNNQPQYIAALGAYERDNFGDALLFKVTEKLLHPWPVVPLTLFSQDMHAEGVGDVLSLSAWLDSCADAAPAAILCVGGEVLTCELKNALSVDWPDEMSTLYAQLPPEKRTELAEHICWHSHTLPYIPNERMLRRDLPGKIRVAINSAGGTTLDSQSSTFRGLRESLRLADFVSVRDQTTQSRIRDMVGSRVELYPDIVTLVSALCRDEIDAARTRIRHRQDAQRPYIVFQANADFVTRNGIDRIANELRAIANRHDLNVVLQAAGTAPRHDRPEQLIEIKRAMSQDGMASGIVHVQESRNIWDQVQIS